MVPKTEESTKGKEYFVDFMCFRKTVQDVLRFLFLLFLFVSFYSCFL